MDKADIARGGRDNQGPTYFVQLGNCKESLAAAQRRVAFGGLAIRLGFSRCTATVVASAAGHKVDAITARTPSSQFVCDSGEDLHGNTFVRGNVYDKAPVSISSHQPAGYCRID